MQFYGIAEKYKYVDDPYMISKALFAIEQKNKELDIVCLVTTTSTYFELSLLICFFVWNTYAKHVRLIYFLFMINVYVYVG